MGAEPILSPLFFSTVRGVDCDGESIKPHCHGLIETLFWSPCFLGESSDWAERKSGGSLGFLEHVSLRCLMNFFGVHVSVKWRMSPWETIAVTVNFAT